VSLFRLLLLGVPCANISFGDGAPIPEQVVRKPTPHVADGSSARERVRTSQFAHGFVRLEI